MLYFVNTQSIVRKIWGKGDTILFIFAGASAEFALNKAVDWLYFTGKLPADPLGRLFSTVAYARRIIFSENQAAIKAIDQITAIHQSVEQSRGAQIPDWAYRDVLFMLIDYSIRSYEVMERKLTDPEKAEVFDVFYRVGMQMGLTGLPQIYAEWMIMRESHLRENMISSVFTVDLYKQYRKHLGFGRYTILLQAQLLVVPQRVNQLLSLGKTAWLKPIIFIYRITRSLGIDGLLKNAVLPLEYKKQIMDLDIANA